MKYAFVFLLVACASQSDQLTKYGKNVEVYGTKPTDCSVVGKLSGTNNQGSKELALNQILNQAGSINATGVFVNQEVPNGKNITVHATAYNCGG